LLADEFIELGRSGRVFDKRQIVEALHEEQRDPTDRASRSLTGFSARRLAPDVGLITYRIVRRTPDRPEATGALRSSIWKRTGGQGERAGIAAGAIRPAT